MHACVRAPLLLTEAAAAASKPIQEPHFPVAINGASLCWLRRARVLRDHMPMGEGRTCIKTICTAGSPTPLSAQRMQAGKVLLGKQPGQPLQLEDAQVKDPGRGASARYAQDAARMSALVPPQDEERRRRLRSATRDLDLELEPQQTRAGAQRHCTGVRSTG
eukprot:scaffold4762_cov398-Prasinococcus_capsulatus_cf.AAC.8